VACTLGPHTQQGWGRKEQELSWQWDLVSFTKLTLVNGIGPDFVFNYVARAAKRHW